jgi:hypothetical protein
MPQFFFVLAIFKHPVYVIRAIHEHVFIRKYGKIKDPKVNTKKLILIYSRLFSINYTVNFKIIEYTSKIKKSIYYSFFHM